MELGFGNWLEVISFSSFALPLGCLNLSMALVNQNYLLTACSRCAALCCCCISWYLWKNHKIILIDFYYFNANYHLSMKDGMQRIHLPWQTQSKIHNNTRRNTLVAHVIAFTWRIWPETRSWNSWSMISAQNFISII